MDKEISASEIKKRKIKNLSKIVLALIFVIISLIALRAVLRRKIKRSRIITEFAERGPLNASITASGTIVPEFEQVIISPVRSKIDSVFKKAGDNIFIGESILKLNQDNLLNQFDKLNDQYEMIANNKEQRRLQLEQNLIDVQANYDIKKLRIQYLESKLEVEEYLKEKKISLKEDYEQAQLNVQIAKREAEQLEGTIENQKKSLKVDLTKLDLEMKILQNQISELQQQINECEATSDRQGVITWVNDDIGASVNIGDVVARIADLNHFKVNAQISDIHASKLIAGGEVAVEINETELVGTVTSIKPTIQNGIITFVVELENNDHELLRSNLRVDVHVITSRKENVVIVKNGPFVNGSGIQKVYVVKGKSLIRREVIIGETNFDYVEIERGIAAGEEVVISNMQDYIHVSEIKLINK